MRINDKVYRLAGNAFSDNSDSGFPTSGNPVLSGDFKFEVTDNANYMYDNGYNLI